MITPGFSANAMGPETRAYAWALMNVHPCITISDGRLTVADQVRGNRAKAMEYLLERTMEHAERMDPWRVDVTHVGCENDAVYLTERLRELTRAREIVITRAGSAVSSHCGPGTIGVLFIEK